MLAELAGLCDRRRGEPRGTDDLQRRRRRLPAAFGQRPHLFSRCPSDQRLCRWRVHRRPRHRSERIAGRPSDSSVRRNDRRARGIARSRLAGAASAPARDAGQDRWSWLSTATARSSRICPRAANAGSVASCRRRIALIFSATRAQPSSLPAWTALRGSSPMCRSIFRRRVSPSPSGLDKHSALAPVETAMLRGFLLIFAGLGIGFLAAWLVGRYFVGRPVNALLDATRSWQHGDYAARVALRTARRRSAGSATPSMKWRSGCSASSARRTCCCARSTIGS